MTDTTITELVGRMIAAMRCGDDGEAERLRQQIRQLTAAAAPPARRANRRVMAHTTRR